MNTQTQSIVNIPLKHGINQYPVAVGAARSIVAFNPVGITVWVDQSVTPSPCTFTLANAAEQVPLSAGGYVGKCGNLFCFTTCFA
jgi:hypothetical protein